MLRSDAQAVVFYGESNPALVARADVSDPPFV
jgi:hypothetical protein